MLAFTLQMAAPPSAISINHKQILSALDVFNLQNRTCKSFFLQNGLFPSEHDSSGGQWSWSVCVFDDEFYYLLHYISLSLSKQKYIPQQCSVIDVILIHILSLLQIINI